MSTPQKSLTNNPRLMRLYQQAEHLVEQGEFKKALAGFTALVDAMASENVILLIDEYTRIMMSIGFCHADLFEYDKALTVYHELETILKRGDGWSKSLPKGLQLGIPSSFDPSLSLAGLSDSIALAYDASSQLEKAKSYYAYAIKTYLKLGEKELAARTWHYIGNNAKRRQQWGLLEQAGLKIAELHEQIGNLAGQLQGWQFIVQAAMNQADLEKAARYSEKAVQAGKTLNHPDLPRDQRVMGMIKQELAKTKTTEAAPERKKTPTTAPANNKPVSQAALFERITADLKAFATTHDGPQQQVIKQIEKSGFLGLSQREVSKTIRRWSTSIEEITQYNKDGVMGAALSAVLEFHQATPWMIQVSAPSEDSFKVGVLLEIHLPNIPQPGYQVLRTDTIPATSSDLQMHLNTLMREKALYRAQGQLRCLAKAK